MFNYLQGILKHIEGNIITIGIDDKLINVLKQNKKVNVYEINKSDGISLFRKKKRTTSSGKKINIKKLSKYFKKKSIDYIICDYEQIERYYKYIFRDSIYLNNNMIYFYAKNDIDIDYINKYKRYHSSLDIKEFKEYNVAVVNNTNSKTNKIKDIYYYLIDTLTNFIDFISNILVG